jgi:hypothetical protein
MLVKMRNPQKKAEMNFTDFCKWVGTIIEPSEGFFFRHDSEKNPQFEKNL